MNKPNILFLADTTHHTQAVTDHIKAITTHDKINWHIVNPITCKTLDKFDFSHFNGLGIHYSIKPYTNYYLSEPLKKRIAHFGGLKFLFLQDEYQKVNQVQEFLYALKFDLLFTLVNQKLVTKAYPDPRLAELKKITVLTGYVHDAMKSIESPPIAARAIDVSYRGRRYDYWLGALAYEKEFIATRFIQSIKDTMFKVDISFEESDRLYGNSWLQLLQNSKAVLGTESGASIWDFDDSIRKKTYQYLKKHQNASFDMVFEELLKPFDGTILYNAISPRVFEAAATKTAMIMFPGDYSGVCKPHEHYIVLEKDFSNIDEVLSKLQDTEYLQQLADRTYNDLIASNLYSQHQLAQLVGNELLAEINLKEEPICPSEIESKLNSTFKKYKLLNQIRCLITESNFILANFINLMFTPERTFNGKINLLLKGLKRYLAYLLPRLKNTNS
jgi:hypothetical protein